MDMGGDRDTSPEGLRRRTQELRALHEASVANLRQLEQDFERWLKAKSEAGLTADEAAAVEVLKEELASLRVQSASNSEQAELVEELEERKDVDQ